MERNQKVVLVCIISITAIAWIFSKDQPDTMKAMMVYDPIEISLFSITWTVGMSAMMFPSITPMILFYNREIRSRTTNRDRKAHCLLSDGAGDGNQRKTRTLSLPILYGALNLIFVGSYLAIWTIIGVTLLLAWSVPANNFLAHFETRQQFQVFGIILIISGVYQFSLLKRKCIGYFESPKHFFMRTWNNGVRGAINMGVRHGLSCVGSCLPYCVLMIALGWMNLLWMGLFTCIIFGEKMWSRGIWIARSVGIGFAVIGIMIFFGLITIPTDMIM